MKWIKKHDPNIFFISIWWTCKKCKCTNINNFLNSKIFSNFHFYFNLKKKHKALRKKSNLTFIQCKQKNKTFAQQMVVKTKTYACSECMCFFLFSIFMIIIKTKQKNLFAYQQNKPMALDWQLKRKEKCLVWRYSSVHSVSD